MIFHENRHENAGRRFSWNIMHYLLFLKKQQNLKLSSAANYWWRFKGSWSTPWDNAISQLLLDFSLTVKAATLIFISGCGSAISSAKEGKSGFIYNLVRVKKLLSRANVRAFHENPNGIHTELTFSNPQSAWSQYVCFLSSTKLFEAS